MTIEDNPFTVLGSILGRFAARLVLSVLRMARRAYLTLAGTLVGLAVSVLWLAW